MSCKLLW